MIFSSIRCPWYSLPRQKAGRLISLCLIATFVTTMVIAPRASYAGGVMGLPQPGTMVDLSPAYVPLMITGLTVHPENPLLMDFIVSTGNSGLNANQVKKESDRLIKYFLACLTIPENNQWVNLSPYEKQRIVPEDLGQTVLGQDMLAQDYLLKQLTASLIYPEKNLGKNFWDKVYAKASQMYGTTQIPVNTFNKVWILPDTAKVYEHKDTVFVVKSHLKVMLDEDYLALSKHNSLPNVNNLGNQIVRQIILPAIEQEVNTGKNFAQLRQIYNSMILAVWFKKNLKQALLNQVYTDKSKVNGVNVDDPAIKEKIYKQYLQAYKKGVFNYIKEEFPPLDGEGKGGVAIPRKYFSGGLIAVTDVAMATVDEAMAAFSGLPGETFKVSGLTQEVATPQRDKVPTVRASLAKGVQVFGVGAEVSMGPGELVYFKIGKQHDVITDNYKAYVYLGDRHIGYAQKGRGFRGLLSIRVTSENGKTVFVVKNTSGREGTYEKDEAMTAAVLPRVNPTTTTSWKKLSELAANRERYGLKDLFAKDPQRAERFLVALNSHLDVDFSKNLIDEEILNTLLDLANEVSLKDATQKMFGGEKINETEQRAALHVALRNVKRDPTTGKLVAANGPIMVDRQDVMPKVIEVLEKMEAFTKKVQSGEWRGASGKKIKNIINVGIGGSDLGPKMAVEALRPYKAGDVDAYFISNIDGTAAAELMKKLNPEETLVIIASKTFTTQETMQNAQTLKNWVLNAYQGTPYQGSPEIIKKHFVAVSTEEKLVTDFGIDKKNMFEFWDWVGGRYSVWSAIGLSLATYIGFDNFLQFLEGGREADDHFRTQPFRQNIPVLKALLNVWYGNFLKADTFAILPYDQYMSLFPAFAQQFFMESNGKSVDRNGNPVNYNTGLIAWGAAGTDGQHSFYQLIHQGTRLVPADFIGIMNSHNPLPGHHDKLFSNFVAQTEALAFGATTEKVRKDLEEDLKYKGQDLDWHAMQQTFTGNKPTTSILIDQMTPKTLGNLIALYEHQIFTEGIIWDIFSFDQWGVQLGKLVADKKVLPFLNGTRSLDELVQSGLSPAAQRIVRKYIEAQARPVDNAMAAGKMKVHGETVDAGPVLRATELLKQDISEENVTPSPLSVASGPESRNWEMIHLRELEKETALDRGESLDVRKGIIIDLETAMRKEGFDFIFFTRKHTSLFISWDNKSDVTQKVIQAMQTWVSNLEKEAQDAAMAVRGKRIKKALERFAPPIIDEAKILGVWRLAGFPHRITDDGRLVFGVEDERISRDRMGPPQSKIKGVKEVLEEIGNEVIRHIPRLAFEVKVKDRGLMEVRGVVIGGTPVVLSFYAAMARNGEDIEDDDGPQNVVSPVMTAVTVEDLLRNNPTLKVASDADQIKNWVSPHKKPLEEILNSVIKEYDIRGYDGGDDRKYATQIDDTLWRWIGRALGSIPFTSQRHQRKVGLESGDFYLIAGDNGPSTGGLGEVLDSTGKKMPNVIEAISSGFMDTGVNIINLNVVGSGALYSTIVDFMEELKKNPEKFRKILEEAGIKLTDVEFDNLKRVKGGLYVTRSHVEIGTNGAKPNIDGITLYGDMLQAMKPFIINGIYREVTPEKRGKIFKNDWMRETALDIYEKSIKEQFSGLKTSLENVAKLAKDSGKPVPQVIINFSGGSLAATKRVNGEKFYLKLFQDVLGGNLKEVLRSEGDTWNENGGLADPTRLDAVALGHPKMNVVQISEDDDKRNDIIINFDLDADRMSILQNGRLFLGDEMFYPVIEYQLTLDRYAETHRTQVPIYFDSRMKSEFAAQVRKYGGIAKIHPKGHSKVKATIDVDFMKLVNKWAAETGNTATKEAFLKAHPGFKIVQAEYSTHMFMTDTHGNAFDDAVRFSLFWLQAFAEIEIAKQKSMTMAEYIQEDKDDPANPLPDSKQLKEQRTSVSSIGDKGKIVPVSDDQKKALIYRMTDKVKTFFSGRAGEFEYVPDWQQYEGNNKPFTLVDVGGVYHLFINKPGLEGEIFWGWSNTSNKVAFGTQSSDANVNKKLASIAVELLVESRKEIAAETGLNWIPIEDLETQALSDLFGGLEATEIEASVTGQYPNVPAALETLISDKAMKGGIDLNSRNLNMQSEGEKVNITFDPAMIAQFRRGDFSGVRIQILDVVPVNLMPLLGLRELN